MDFDYCEEYLKGLYQTKYYYGNVKNITFLFSSNLQMDKKINNVKEDPRRFKFWFFPKDGLPSSCELLIRINVT